MGAGMGVSVGRGVAVAVGAGVGVSVGTGVGVAVGVGVFTAARSENRTIGLRVTLQPSRPTAVNTSWA